MSSNEAPSQQSPLPWIKSPSGVFNVYANSVHITWSVDDVRIRLAQVVDNPETPTPGKDFRGASEERAALTVSWRMAKLLRDELARAIENFEKTNGPIKGDVKLPVSIP
jgi:hypothetical protein